MKKYTKPIVVKVALNPEQAVLGTCMVGSPLKDNRQVGCKPDCKSGKDLKDGDHSASS